MISVRVASSSRGASGPKVMALMADNLASVAAAVGPGVMEPRPSPRNCSQTRESGSGGKAEDAAGEDVLLHLGGAAADGQGAGEEVGALPGGAVALAGHRLGARPAA